MSVESEAQASERRYIVLVTGFGPFEGFPVNYSWETVKHLWALKWPSNIKLITREIPVVYEIVSEQVPKMWQELNPDLVIHLGVSGVARNICIEKQSFNTPYYKCDVTNKCPDTKCCKIDGERCLQTKLDVTQLCNYANECSESRNLKSKCEVSQHPGDYLCGYIYYTSLSEDSSKTLFIHVPPEHVFDTYDMAQTVQSIIFNSLKQLYDVSL